MFAAPIAPGCAHAALHFVNNQQDIVLVGNRSQFLQPLTPKMVVAAFALDWLDDDRANVDVALLDEVSDLALSLLFALDHVRFALRFRKRKINVRTRDARPIKFGKQIRLARIGVSQAHRVTAPPMESASEMQHLRAAFAVPRGHVLPYFPIHRRFQTILHGQRAAVDEQITLERRQTDDALKRRDKFSVTSRINIRVGNLHFRRAQQIALYLRIIEMWVVKPDGRGSKEAVEIDEAAIIDSVLQI